MLSCCPSHVPHAIGTEASASGDDALNAAIGCWSVRQMALPCASRPIVDPGSRSHRSAQMLDDENAVGDHAEQVSAVANRFTTTMHGDDVQILAVGIMLASMFAEAGWQVGVGGDGVGDDFVDDVVDDDFLELKLGELGCGGGDFALVSW